MADVRWTPCGRLSESLSASPAQSASARLTASVQSVTPSPRAPYASTAHCAATGCTTDRAAISSSTASGWSARDRRGAISFETEVQNAVLYGPLLFIKSYQTLVYRLTLPTLVQWGSRSMPSCLRPWRMRYSMYATSVLATLAACCLKRPRTAS